MIGKKVSMLSATAKYLIMVSAVITMKIFYELRSFMMVLFISSWSSSPGLTNIAASK